MMSSKPEHIVGWKMFWSDTVADIAAGTGVHIGMFEERLGQ